LSGYNKFVIRSIVFYLHKLENMDNQKLLAESANYIRKADVLIITAGAGMGVDSGLPDFRGEKGLWKKRENRTQYNDFINNPKKAWYFYGTRYNEYKNTKPHIGFYKLLEISKSKKDYYIFTSNVDEHFQKAGFDTEKIEECHGSIFMWQCSMDCQKKVWIASYPQIKIDTEKKLAIDYPVCPDCGRPVRPNILLFGDRHWNPDYSKSQGVENSYRLRDLESEKLNYVVIEFGAGKAIPTVRRGSEKLSQKYNAPLIRVNPHDSELEGMRGVALPMSAKMAIDELYQLM